MIKVVSVCFMLDVIYLFNGEVELEMLVWLCSMCEYVIDEGLLIGEIVVEVDKWLIDVFEQFLEVESDILVIEIVFFMWQCIEDGNLNVEDIFVCLVCYGLMVFEVFVDEMCECMGMVDEEFESQVVIFLIEFVEGGEIEM